MVVIYNYSINWSVFITEECLLRGTDWIFIIQFEVRLERIKSREIISNTLYKEERIIMIGLDMMANR